MYLKLRWYLVLFTLCLSLTLPIACGNPTSTKEPTAGGEKAAPGDAATPEQGVGQESASPETGNPENTTPEGGKKPTCVPSKEAWDNHAKRLIGKWCGQCHGEKPNFGAPHSLIEYADLLKGEVGKRKVDRIVARMLKGEMPPEGYPRPEHNDLDTIVEWASCGKEHADHTIGLRSSAPVFIAPKKAPSDWEYFDLTANKFAVGEKTLDLYQCFTFDVPVKTDRFLRRIQVVIDESRVLHHAVLLKDTHKKHNNKMFRCNGLPSDSAYLYAWAPGAGNLQFPNGGLRMKPGDRFILQIHYNNGAGIKGVKDSSGVRLFHTKPEGEEYGMLSPGPIAYAIPPKQKFKATGYCQFKEDTKIIAGMPHMHEIGLEFEQTIIRKDGKEEPFIKVTGWNFEAQFFYKTPALLKKGDTLVTSCLWENKTSKLVTSGTKTEQEMCFNFMYISPPPKGQFCDGPDPRKQVVVNYKPGKCAPKDAKSDLKQIPGLFVVGKPKTFKGGTIPEGHWLLEKMQIFLDTAKTSFGTLDLKASSVPSKGQLWTGKRTVFDVNTRLAIRMENSINFDRDLPTSMAGVLKEQVAKGLAKLTPDCGQKNPVDFQYEVDGDTLRISLSYKFAGLKFTPEFVFKLQKK